MRIAMLGAGAMGSIFGGQLAAAGNDVVLINVDEDYEFGKLPKHSMPQI